MLSHWLTPHTIQVVDKVKNWQHAVQLSGEPLLAQQIIQPRYIEAIFQLHEQLGPYSVLAPGLAMPHARPEQGANKLGLSLLVVRQGVNFQSEYHDPIYVVVMLASPDRDSHLTLLTELAALFADQQAMSQLKQAKQPNEIRQIIASSMA